MQVAVAEEPLRIGEIIDGKYRVDRLVGGGGMGAVFAVTHLVLGTKMAIKILKPEALSMPGVSVRFLREARAASRLKSDHVGRVLDVGEHASGLPFMVMELLEGKDLEAMIAQGQIAPELAVEYIIQACEALGEAHAHGTIHRDIKPANLFVTQRNDRPWVKVLDFGIATASYAEVESLTKTQTVIGSPTYMSPEQHRTPRDVDGRSDIWSLGVCLYEMLSGRPPFYEQVYGALLIKIATEPHEPLRNVSISLGAVVDRCLAKRRDDRYQHVSELARALSRVSMNPIDDETTTTIGTLPAEGRRPAWKKHWPMIAGGVAIASGAIATVVALSGGSPSNGPADAALIDLHVPTVMIGPDAAPSDAAPPIEISFASEPEGGLSRTGSTMIECRTPCSLQLDPSPAVSTFVVKREGYVDGTIVVDLALPRRDYGVVLEKLDVTGPITIEPNGSATTRPKVTPPKAPPPPTTGCDRATIDQAEDTMKDAFGSSEDTRLQRALDAVAKCDLDQNILVMATISACRLGSLPKAKAWFGRIKSPQKQSQAEGRCLSFKILVR